MKKCIILCTTLFCLLPYCLFAQGLTYEEQMYDFGHIGIDFEVQHTFIFVNRTDVPVKIKDIVVSCDCTTVRTTDTLVEPNDTAFFDLTFDTKDYYGPINKSFTILTDHPKIPELQYFYISIVGQWFNGLKPNPISLFFLPSKKSNIIEIPNKSFDVISVSSVSHSRNIVTTKVLTEKGSKGKSVQIEVTPNNDLGVGSYHTTVTIGIKSDDNEESWFSIPVKIVRY